MKKKIIFLDKRFVTFAELLVQIMLESDATLSIVASNLMVDAKNINFNSVKIPKKVIIKTALDIQKDFENGVLIEKNGMLYDEYSIEDYGGRIIKSLTKQLKNMTW